MHTETPKMEPAMMLALAANFGSVQRWHDEFLALCKALGSRPGWVSLVFQPSEGTLVNQWAANPDTAGGVPILQMHRAKQDIQADLGAAADAEAAAPNAADADADAFMKNIPWPAVYESYQHAVHAASGAWGVSAAELTDKLDGILLLDVRRAGVFEKAGIVIPGARWCDPAAVAQWAAELPAGRQVVVYCVYGHEVGRATALRLRAAGLQARYLQGGIDGWQAAGHPLQVKGQAEAQPEVPAS